MVEITKKTWEENDVEVIIVNGTKWRNEMDIQEGLNHANLQALTKKYRPEQRRCRWELVDEPKKQSNRIRLLEDLALKIVMDCRTVEACNFKRRLGFNLHDVINIKEQTIVGSIKDAFEGENMQSECYKSGYRIDLYFLHYRLVIEIDELDRYNRDIEYEKERERRLKG